MDVLSLSDNSFAFWKVFQVSSSDFQEKHLAWHPARWVLAF
jgi:hypothetical protein